MLFIEPRLVDADTRFLQKRSSTLIWFHKDRND